MKLLSFSLFLVLTTLASHAFAQTSTHTHDAVAPASAADAQKAFDRLKTLAGSWVGRVTTTPQAPGADGQFVQFSLRVTSRGHALVHEMSVSGLPDHPLTVFYLDADSLTLTHYCDAGNRPRMTGRISPDGRTLEFDFLDLSGGDQRGHMHRAVFTFIDDNRHIEEWTYMAPGNTPMRARFDLQRTNFEGAGAR
jgi:hypothetical protein